MFLRQGHMPESEMIGAKDTRVSKQNSASKRWLSKPGVREAQNEKSRLRMQRLRQQRKLAETNRAALSDQPPTPDSDQPTTPDNVNNDKAHSILNGFVDLPATLPDIRLAIHQWHLDEWDPEADWDLHFNRVLQEKREAGKVKIFLGACDIHARQGRRFIRALRKLARDSCSRRNGREGDTHLQIFDLLTSTVSEVKFFEVKLHEYAPLRPLSTCNDIHV